MTCCVVVTGLQGQTVLHAAAQWDHPGVVDLLLLNGANPNAMFKVSLCHCQDAVDINHYVAHIKPNHPTLLEVASLAVSTLHWDTYL